MPVTAQCCSAVAVACTTPGGDHITNCSLILEGAIASVPWSSTFLD